MQGGLKMYKDVKEILKNIEKLVNKNEDGTYTIKMPGDTEDYVVKDLTNREEQKAKSLATAEIPEEDMCMIRSIVLPKITTDMLLDLPSKIRKRLSYVQKFLDGDLDFLY